MTSIPSIREVKPKKVLFNYHSKNSNKIQDENEINLKNF